MLFAKKIKMCNGCHYSKKCIDIAEIYLSGDGIKEGFYPKAVVHDYIIDNEKSIVVYLGTMPYLLPGISVSGEKYVRSEPNDTPYDNLLALPKVY